MSTDLYHYPEHYFQTSIALRSQDDPLEIALRIRIENILTQSAWATTALTRARTTLTHCLTEALAYRHVPERLRAISRRACKVTAACIRTRVTNPTDLRIHARILDGPCLVLMNHLAVFKQCSIHTADVHVHIPQFPRICPFWADIAVVYPLARVWRHELSLVSHVYPGVFHELHLAAGYVHVHPIDTTDRITHIEMQVRALLARQPHTMLVMFPEGRTSGKINESDPYHLLPYRRGAYALARTLDIPRILVAQFFDPHLGMRLHILDVARLPTTGNTRCVCKQFAESDRARTQTWLDEQLALVHPEFLEQRVAY